jgi:hypothetical protein
MDFGIQCQRSRKSCRIAGHESLISLERFVILPERLEIAGHGKAGRIGQLILRKLVEERLEGRVRFRKFLVVMLCIGE